MTKNFEFDTHHFQFLLYQLRVIGKKILKQKKEEEREMFSLDCTSSFDKNHKTKHGKV